MLHILIFSKFRVGIFLSQEPHTCMRLDYMHSEIKNILFWSMFCILYFLRTTPTKTKYERRSFNVVIGVLQGALLIPFTFRLLPPFEVFSLDGNTLFKSRNSFCKGRDVGLIWYTLKTLVNCTTKCTSGFITTTRKGFI